MDGRGNKLPTSGGAGEYIWLHYGTQFNMSGRSYTIEMNIPMPIGASEDMREQLLREADAGMNQVASHVENRVAQLLQRVQPTQGKIPTPAPVAKSAPQTRPASLPAPQTGPQPLQSPSARVREDTLEAVDPPAIAVPPTRLNIGASMPSVPAMGDSSNLSLQQFISYIRENMGLNPKQAMDLLKIKTLSSVNLREAVEQLQKIVNNESVTQVEQRAPETVATVRQNSGPLASKQFEPTRAPAHSGAERRRVVSEEEPTYAFDEEVDLDENSEDDLEDFDFPREFTAQERVQARSKLDSLRESRGATLSNQARQQALMNVIDTQITAEQLHDLMMGAWNVSTIKKLKVDQVEALISWAKQDDFVNEAEAMLAILEEE